MHTQHNKKTTANDLSTINQSVQQKTTSKKAQKDGKANIRAKQQPIQRKLQNAYESKEGQKQPIQAKQAPIQRASSQKVAPHLQQYAAQKYGADLSRVNIQENSPFPSSVNAKATIQDNSIHIAPGESTTVKNHEIGHAIDNQLNGAPKANAQVNGQAVNTDPTRESAADRIGTELGNVPVQRQVVESPPPTMSTVQLKNSDTHVIQRKINKTQGANLKGCIEPLKAYWRSIGIGRLFRDTLNELSTDKENTYLLTGFQAAFEELGNPGTDDDKLYAMTEALILDIKAYTPFDFGLAPFQKGDKSTRYQERPSTASVSRDGVVSGNINLSHVTVESGVDAIGAQPLSVAHGASGEFGTGFYTVSGSTKDGAYGVSGKWSDAKDYDQVLHMTLEASGVLLALGIHDPAEAALVLAMLSNPAGYGVIPPGAAYQLMSQINVRGRLCLLPDERDVRVDVVPSASPAEDGKASWNEVDGKGGVLDSYALVVGPQRPAILHQVRQIAFKSGLMEILLNRQRHDQAEWINSHKTGELKAGSALADTQLDTDKAYTDALAQIRQLLL
ncbi:hypothetical protein [uncultured Microscilla sp.]|uniref:hypothetical protein n=1 Tax=uncultured Microscilla sp. TaxID=432653 RepID=UPI002605C1B9|nr:hypothetical protein [uncultured Microscilla sp.]